MSLGTVHVSNANGDGFTEHLHTCYTLLLPYR